MKKGGRCIMSRDLLIVGRRR